MRNLEYFRFINFILRYIEDDDEEMEDFANKLYTHLLTYEKDLKTILIEDFGYEYFCSYFESDLEVIGKFYKEYKNNNL